MFLTRKNILGCITFLESFIRVPSFKKTCICNKNNTLDNTRYFRPCTETQWIMGNWVSYSARLDYFMVTIQTVLNLHQLLKVVLNKINACSHSFSSGLKCVWCCVCSFTPCFMMSFAWFATSFTTLRAAE